MALYTYYCPQCDKNVILNHNSSEVATMCPYCRNLNFKKILTPIRDNVVTQVYNVKPGELVKHHINKTKEDIEKIKEEMRNSFFNGDN